MSEFDRAAADRAAAEWRYIITDMICRAGSGHLGGALSLVEIMYTLYFRVMNVDPDDPRAPGRDRLVLSKGHAAPVLYVALARRGFFPARRLGTMNADGTTLPSHADARTVPGIDATTGSLGQGLSVACGMAKAARLDGSGHTVYCIVGDGESNEGQNWEAALFAAHHRLDNLVAVTDYNRLQIDGFTDEVLGLEPLADKWRAFGWATFEMDGHDWDDVHRTILAARAVTGRPAMIIAHTVKAKGCATVENTPGSHNVKVPDRAAYDSLVGALGVTDVALPY
jgi:transketolase